MKKLFSLRGLPGLVVTLAMAMAMAMVMMGTSVFAKSVEEIEFQVIDPQHKHLRFFSKHSEFIVDHVSALGYELYGPAGTAEFLEMKNISFYKVPGPSQKILADYPTSAQVIQKVLELEKKYPTLITTMEIGKSVEGKPLLFARVTAPEQQTNTVAARLEFKYVANMHGDEIAGRELMVKLIEDLAANYGKDNRITKLLDSVQVYIMPSMNPDGADRQARGNSDRIDLNRSFPDFTTNDNQNNPDKRAIEVQAMMKFQAKHNFKLSANFHGGAEVVNYPWDTTEKRHPLSNLVQKISLDYAKRVSYIYESTAFKNGITNGYDWYEVDGGMQDWSDYWHKDLQFTIELTKTKWPAYSTIAKTYELNRDALIAMIENVFLVE